MDAAPAGLAQAARRRVEAIPGATDCHKIHVRTSGARVFVDLQAAFAPDHDRWRMSTV